jgi:phosphatidylserine decarboxylase
MSTNEIKFIDRETGNICTETVMGDKALRFAYETLLGKTLWPGMFFSAFPSWLMGKFYDSSLSHKSIAKLAYMPGLHLEEAEKNWQEYRSFNDFFTRRLKSGCRPAAEGEKVLVSPADGRITIYPDMDSRKAISIKGLTRPLEELCCKKLENKAFHVAVVRLAPVDYHRFHFPCNCSQIAETMRIPGKYHSVNPIALKTVPDVFAENTRHITSLTSPYFGEFIYIEVGAFGVGSIVQTSRIGKHQKMDEKGMFKFGGSTVVLIMDAQNMQFDDDLLTNSGNGLETMVRCGQKIGTAK